MTREKTILAVAKQIAADESRKWHWPPNPAQERKQAFYLRRAEKIVSMIEREMREFRWAPG